MLRGLANLFIRYIFINVCHPCARAVPLLRKKGRRMQKMFTFDINKLLSTLFLIIFVSKTVRTLRN